MDEWAPVERTFRAMGSQCRIVVAGPEAASRADWGRRRVQELERCWTRFVDTSELSKLNRARGLSIVSSDLFELARVAADAMRWTGRAFHPLMLDQLCDAGYAADWSSCSTWSTRQAGGPGCDRDILTISELSAVMLPSGGRLDPGGFGKGLAADIVVDALIAMGAPCVCVELGGDLRVAGRPWEGDAWHVEIASPQDRAATSGVARVIEGAVATSSVLGKRWRSEGNIAHHVLDPRTGRPCETDLLTVTVVAARGWQAEVAATVALIGGSEVLDQNLSALGVEGFGWTVRGDVVGPATIVEMESMCS